MILFLIQSDVGTKDEKTRLINLKGWPEALKTGEKWAKGKLRIAEIKADLAKQLFRSVKVEG